MIVWLQNMFRLWSVWVVTASPHVYLEITGSFGNGQMRGTLYRENAYISFEKNNPVKYHISPLINVPCWQTVLILNNADSYRLNDDCVCNLFWIVILLHKTREY